MRRANGWCVEEIHGAWWAYKEPRPADEYFITHNRPLAPRIIGPYFDEEYAIKMAHKNGVKDRI
jgi:hypothetical protein